MLHNDRQAFFPAHQLTIYLFIMIYDSIIHL